MSHTYPLAPTAEAALQPDTAAVRTRREADTLGEELGLEIVALETDWLEVSESEADEIIRRADAAVGQGFVQRYEDEAGRPVLAVTYWKTVGVAAGRQAKGQTPPAVAEPPAREDHTDDLYFRGGRTKRRRRKVQADPRQLDLFTGPDQQGFERRDPDNPGIIITEEEGDGTTFGG